MVHCWISFKIESNIPVIYSRWRPLIKYRNFFDCLLLLYYKSKWPQLLTSATWQLRSVWYFPGFLWFCFSANLYRLNMIFYKHIFKLDKLLKKKNQRKRVIYFKNPIIPRSVLHRWVQLYRNYCKYQNYWARRQSRTGRVEEVYQQVSVSSVNMTFSLPRCYS